MSNSGLGTEILVPSVYAPILGAELSSRLSGLDSDTAMTSAPEASANGIIGRIVARESERRDWPAEAKVGISTFLWPSFPVRARFQSKTNISHGPVLAEPISCATLTISLVQNIGHFTGTLQRQTTPERKSECSSVGRDCSSGASG